MNNDLSPAFVPLPTFSEMVSLTAQPDAADAADYRIAVLRNVTVEPIEVPLKYFCRRVNRRARVRWGAFDNILQDSLRTDGPVGEDTDAVLVFCNLQAFAPQVVDGFVELTAEARRAERQRILQYLAKTLRNVRGTNARCPVFVYAFESPALPAMGVTDDGCPDGQSAWVAALNRELHELCRGVGNCFCLSTEPVLRLLGVGGFYDPRYWAIGRAPYSRNAFVHLAFDAFKIIYALLGRTRKCLVLDCDNVLWGGIVGEDGLDGIRLGPDWPGSSYVAFQRAVLELRQRGVLLAICSRNNAADVWEVFEKHPHMVLRREHFSACRVDWGDKATGLASLADELNIGLDAMVLLDDSDFEIGLVRERCPEVDAIRMPRDAPLGYKTIVKAYGFFDTISTSAEDRRRGEMYRAEAARRKTREGMTIEAYLASLGMTADVRLVDGLSRDRTAQQTQKTSQFNLTTRRYTADDIAALAQADTADVVVLSLKDRFGDYGQVGTAIVRYEHDVATIDTFLLSCRALGRGVEDVFISKVLELCARRGAKSVKGRFRPTSRNAQVASFYPGRGFHSNGERDGEREYLLSLDGRTLPGPPPWFDVTCAF